MSNNLYFPKKLKSLISKFLPEKMRYLYRLIHQLHHALKYEKNIEIQRIGALPRYTTGETKLLGRKFLFADSCSFCSTYKELFNKEIYKFHIDKSNPYIIDAGANIGLSIIYFKKLYPNAEIIAFEPDEKIFEILDSNMKSFGLEDVQIIKKALWDKETVLDFMSEGADAGRIALASDKTQITKVPSVSIRKYINKKVDFLKIDIEGAETTVLSDCSDLLSNVDRIFVEYHSFLDKPQEFGKLVNILENAGYRLNINVSGEISYQPFIKLNNNVGMDMQLNIYAYRS